MENNSRIPKAWPSPAVSLALDPRLLNGSGQRFKPPGVFFDNDDSGNPPNPPSADPQPTNISGAAQKEIARLLGLTNNDPQEAMRLLIRQNYILERRSEKAEAERDRFKTQAPSEADKAAIKWLTDNGGIEAVQKAVTEGTAAITERDQLKQGASRAQAAKALGISDNPLFQQLTNGAQFETVGEGEEQKVQVKAGDKTMSWDEYLKTNAALGLALPSLAVEAAAPSAPSGIPVPGSSASGGAKPDDIVGQVLAARSSAFDPMKPPPAK